MSGGTVVSRRYARALFELAVSGDEVARVEEELKLVSDILTGDKELQSFLQYPNIDTKTKISIVTGALSGKVSDTVVYAVSLLLERGRISIFHDIVNDYKQIADQSLGQAHAVVTTPEPLTEKEKTDIAVRFGKITGKKILIDSVVDPSILGGLQVRIGDRLYDGSLSGKLDRLHQTLHVS